MVAAKSGKLEKSGKELGKSGKLASPKNRLGNIREFDKFLRKLGTYQGNTTHYSWHEILVRCRIFRMINIIYGTKYPHEVVSSKIVFCLASVPVPHHWLILNQGTQGDNQRGSRGNIWENDFLIWQKPISVILICIKCYVSELFPHLHSITNYQVFLIRLDAHSIYIYGRVRDVLLL